MIQAVHLTKTFGRRVSVDDLSFTVREGELYALLGDNGAGKTTTINMLTTLLKPTSGEFYICGFNGTKQVEQAKASFGVVSQEVALYSELTAYENLAFIADLYEMPRAVADQRIPLMLKRAMLTDRAHDQVGRFSTGMQRRLAIAIAMLHNPKVIFMDEPTVGLDPVSRRQIWEALYELKRTGVTILLTTHYLEEAEFLADRIGIIRKGRLVVEGSIEELRNEIRGVSTVTAILSRSAASASELVRKVQKFSASEGNGSAHLDKFRNAIIFTPPRETAAVDYLGRVLGWLKMEGIDFDKFSTTEPSLEDIFLAVQAEGGLLCTR